MKLFTLFFLVFLISINLSAQENLAWKNYIGEVKYPAYLDILVGGSVTSFSNLDGLFGNHAASLGVPINRNWAAGFDVMTGTSGSAHFIKSYAGFGLQGRYVNKRFLGNISFGKVNKADVNGDLISRYNYTETLDFYGRIGVAYRLWKFCSIGIAAYSTTALSYDVYNFNDITQQYDTFPNIENYNISGIAITFGIQLMPPYTSNL